jgi:hypothetical protein
MTPTIRAIHQWYCPNCGLTDTTTEAQPHSRFHVCPKLHGLTAPMVPAGTKAKVEAREREDYVGDEHVQLSPEGRPVMSIVTTRDNGQDVVVFAPTATAKGETRGLD